MQYQDFVRSYEAKSDEDLLRLELESDCLTGEAIAALTSELARRGIGSADKLETFRAQESQRKEEGSKKPGNLFFSFRFGVGRWHFGKADRTYRNDTEIERFRTTVFIVIFFFPLIPTGSYLIEKKRRFRSRKVTVLKRLPLDWEQVLKVWAVAAAGLVAVIWLVKRMLLESPSVSTGTCFTLVLEFEILIRGSSITP